MMSTVSTTQLGFIYLSLFNEDIIMQLGYYDSNFREFHKMLVMYLYRSITNVCNQLIFLLSHLWSWLCNVQQQS